MTELNTKVPRHLWIVGVLSLLWNAMGAFDYTATQLRLDFYMSQVPPDQLAYINSFPSWAIAVWAIAVWGALLGSVGLLLRKSWAVWMFGASIVGMVLTGLYSYVLTDGLKVMGSGGLMFTGFIWLSRSACSSTLGPWRSAASCADGHGVSSPGSASWVTRSTNVSYVRQRTYVAQMTH